MDYKLWTDGAVTQNPGGEASYGFLLYEDGNLLDYGYGIIGSGDMMNNVMAEYWAIREGILSFIKRRKSLDSVLTTYCDSQYVIKQLNGSVSDDKILNWLISQICTYTELYFVWVPRSGNQKADSLAKRLRQ
jgi:ribonuclease HI